ncbi:hypothetical protein CEUSTIGMA_g540.t1 [Chlamydomonas eustigma]|uniref:Uncharacterized protein n=1 Tax=Chlamydomonas eustigma TaxID=1157962 RepID=A0A250WQG7_9CHLO|nr:hypothetical protein CEUSTIGMA_g540.t1 [Chlamydomonas eustigma]|eukprot:GAX73087.1 hypothetical protein CEUSTIGMA_g540.t1 [Chlamydomonas eustigma]
MPRLRVLDQHVIMEAERIKARANIGGDVAALTVAFGKRAPPRNLQYVPVRSKLEEELVKEAARVRDIKVIREREEELKLFSYNPHPDIPRGKSLPPNAGTMQAMAEYYGSNSQTSSTMAGKLADAEGGSSHHRKTGDYHSKGGSSHHRKTGDYHNNSDSESPYHPRDVFVMYSSHAAPNELISAGMALTKPPPGGIGFERRKYERFVTQKAAGTLGQWELSKETMQL